MYVYLCFICRAAFGYYLTNTVVGILSVLMCYILSGTVSAPADGEITELHLFAAIYKHAGDNAINLYVWAVVAFFAIFMSGFISMVNILIIQYINLKTFNADLEGPFLLRNLRIILVRL